MSRNKSGVVVQGAANKAELNYKYEKLQLILIDEIRLIYYKKLIKQNSFHLSVCWVQTKTRQSMNC
jgi:hypothetical protein